MRHAANSIFSVLQCGTRTVLLDGSALYFDLQNRYRLRSHIAHMGSGRCQTQTDTKPIAIYVKSYSFCVPIHCRHMNIQLHLNLSSRALPKSCHLHTAKSIAFSVAVWGQNRFYSDRYSIVFLGVRFRPRSNQYRMQHANWRCLDCLGVGASDRYKTDSNL